MDFDNPASTACCLLVYLTGAFDPVFLHVRFS